MNIMKHIALKLLEAWICQSSQCKPISLAELLLKIINLHWSWKFIKSIMSRKIF